MIEATKLGAGLEICYKFNTRQPFEGQNQFGVQPVVTWTLRRQDRKRTLLPPANLYKIYKESC